MLAFGVLARLRSAALACALASLLGCPQEPTRTREPSQRHEEDPRRSDGDPRVDPARCSGDDLELAALVGTGLCSIAVEDAQPLPSRERLEVITPERLVVAPGERLEFALLLRNRSSDPLDVDLRFRRFLPLAPESTQTLQGESVADESCTLRAMSTEPPPERLTLPPEAELAIPCEWFANTRLINPASYVGSECPDFPALGPGRYRSVFRILGGGGSQREVVVEIEVRAR